MLPDGSKKALPTFVVRCGPDPESQYLDHAPPGGWEAERLAVQPRRQPRAWLEGVWLGSWGCGALIHIAVHYESALAVAVLEALLIAPPLALLGWKIWRTLNHEPR